MKAASKEKSQASNRLMSAHAIAVGEEREEHPVGFIVRSCSNAFERSALERHPFAAFAHRMEHHAFPGGAEVAVEGERHAIPVVHRHDHVTLIIGAGSPFEIAAYAVRPA